MADRKESPAQPARKAGRTERLAAALRANLRRRKTQARSRQARPEEGLADAGGGKKER